MLAVSNVHVLSADHGPPADAHMCGGLQTLLGEGQHSCLQSSVPPRPMPLCQRLPGNAGTIAQKLRLRESGRPAARLCDAFTAAGQLRRQCSFRGHRLAVYCVTYDNLGERIMTGSDDMLVKVCTHTGLGCCTALHKLQYPH